MTEEEIADLRWHWGSAYAILNPEPDVWLAQRRDDLTVLRATSPEELRTKINDDYRDRPVPRLAIR